MSDLSAGNAWGETPLKPLSGMDMGQPRHMATRMQAAAVELELLVRIMAPLWIAVPSAQYLVQPGARSGTGTLAPCSLWPEPARPSPRPRGGGTRARPAARSGLSDRPGQFPAVRGGYGRHGERAPQRRPLVRLPHAAKPRLGGMSPFDRGGHDRIHRRSAEQIIVAAEVTQAGNDVEQLEPMLAAARATLAAAGIATPIAALVVDAGYWRAANVDGSIANSSPRSGSRCYGPDESASSHCSAKPNRTDTPAASPAEDSRPHEPNGNSSPPPATSASSTKHSSPASSDKDQTSGSPHRTSRYIRVPTTHRFEQQPRTCQRAARTSTL